jgi:CHAT domain-containing protein
MDRYQTHGEVGDLNRAITLLEQAVVASEDSAVPSECLNNLGLALHARYERSGSMADVERSIELHRQAIEKLPPDAPQLGGCWQNLSMSLQARADRTRRPADLNEAIRASEQAVARTPDGDPTRADVLNSLGVRYSSRHERTKNADDVKRAIATLEQARAAASKGHPAWTGILNNLGQAYSYAYLQGKDAADLHSAVAAFREAVAETPTDSPHFPRHLNNLGNGLKERYALAGDENDLRDARNAYQQAARQGLISSAEEGLRSARQWLLWAVERRAWEEVTEAYGYISQAIGQLFLIQSGRLHKEQWLYEAQGLPAEAAYAFGRLKRPADAVLYLERDRARLLAEALARSRLELEQQRAGGPAQPDPEQPLSYRPSTPGVEESLRPMTIEDVRSARSLLGPNGALVYLAAATHGSIGLIVAAGGVEAIDLPLTAAEFSRLLWKEDEGGYLSGQLGDGAALDKALADLLPVLGNRLLEPVARRLRELAADRVALVPVGRLALLPLHAPRCSWQPDGKCLLDEWPVIYAPSAGALLEAARPRRRPDVLAVALGHPRGPKVKPAYFTDLLAREVNELLKGDSPLLHEHATAEGLESLLRSRAPAHLFLGCHGIFEPNEPLASGLDLADARLTLERLLDNARLPATELVTLCACQSAISDFQTLPDEVISLPAGLLQAGARAVVATLWTVDALPTVLLLRRFYRCLVGGARPDGALAHSVAWLRQLDRPAYLKEVKELKSRADSATAGMLDFLNAYYLEFRPFASPRFWSAFTLTGYPDGGSHVP